MAEERNLQLEILAKMAEDWQDTTSAMLSVTVALVLVRLGETTVTVPLDNVAEIMRKFNIDRAYIDIEGQPHMVVTLMEKTDVLPGGDDPAEQTGRETGDQTASSRVDAASRGG